MDEGKTNKNKSNNAAVYNTIVIVLIRIMIHDTKRDNDVQLI